MDSSVKPKADKYVAECQDVLRALKGDIVAMAKIADRLQNNDRHLHSFICSMIKGSTKFEGD